MRDLREAVDAVRALMPRANTTLTSGHDVLAAEVAAASLAGTTDSECIPPCTANAPPSSAVARNVNDTVRAGRNFDTRVQEPPLIYVSLHDLVFFTFRHVTKRLLSSMNYSTAGQPTMG
jgi:hypothetical protein